MQINGSSVGLLATTSFANDVGQMNWIVLACLLLGFVFCVLVAIVRVVLGENKIVSAGFLVIIVGVTWVGYENASEFPRTSALGLAVNLVPVQTSALCAESMNELLGGQR